MTQAKLGLVAVALIVGCAGCSGSLFSANSAYDSQACVEDSLRRNPNSRDAIDAAAVMSTACLEGDAAACSVHALMLELGAGVPEDRVHARALYRKACSENNHRACANLSRLELTFVKDPGAIAVATDRLLVACDEGEPSACAEAASLMDGRTDRDPEKKRWLLDRACQSGQTKACFDLAELSSVQDPSDPARLELYVRACVGGHEPACVRLGGGRRAVAATEQNVK